MKNKNNKLPESFRSLLWSYDFKNIDPEKMKKTIVVQALKYGTMKEWGWIRKTFGDVEIREILKGAPQGQFAEKNKNLVSLFFDFHDWKTTPRGIK